MIFVGIPAFAAFAWSVVAPQPLAEPEETLLPAQAEISAGDEVSQMGAKLEQASSEVRARLHMPAMLEMTDNPADDAEIAELYQSGWIIDATVEEVEAALKAAAATPGPEDDSAALVFAHRASCRYFLKE